MEIIRTPIEGLIIFRPAPIRDERGYFSRTIDVQILADAGIDPASFKQENQSRSYQGVRRGLDGRSDAGEAKLVRCASGAVHSPGDDHERPAIARRESAGLNTVVSLGRLRPIWLIDQRRLAQSPEAPGPAEAIGRSCQDETALLQS